MSMPMYVSPEQLMKDRADYARAGVTRGRSVLVLSYADGILLLAQNPSAGLHKISEIYDRIGFAAVGRYNEFETLRQAGVRFADLRGYSYARADVTAHGLVAAYAQTLAGVFTTEAKPYEVELVVAELGDTADTDGLFRISFDGSVFEAGHHVALGGQAAALDARLADVDTRSMDLQAAKATAIDALTGGDTTNLDAAVLDRTTPRRRTFTRLDLSAKEA